MINYSLDTDTLNPHDHTEYHYDTAEKSIAISEDLITYKTLFILFPNQDHQSIEDDYLRYFNIEQEEEFVCSICSENGHLRSQCQYLMIRDFECTYCLSDEHSRFMCKTIMTEKEKSMNFEYSDTTEVLCFRCGEEGHANCGEVVDDQIYTV